IASAYALPRPWPAPVTTTRLPSSSIRFTPLVVVSWPAANSSSPGDTHLVELHAQVAVLPPPATEGRFLEAPVRYLARSAGHRPRARRPATHAGNPMAGAFLQREANRTRAKAGRPGRRR